MVRVGIRELKNRLSRYLRLVRQGETIIVTDRDVAVAELRPRTESTDSSFERYLDDLELSGRLTRATEPAVSATEVLEEAHRLGRVTGWREALAETREG